MERDTTPMTLSTKAFPEPNYTRWKLVASKKVHVRKESGRGEILRKRTRDTKNAGKELVALRRRKRRQVASRNVEHAHAPRGCSSPQSCYR